jgi:hypothetical protein
MNEELNLYYKEIKKINKKHGKLIQMVSKKLLRQSTENNIKFYCKFMKAYKLAISYVPPIDKAWFFYAVREQIENEHRRA